MPFARSRSHARRAAWVAVAATVLAGCSVNIPGPIGNSDTTTNMTNGQTSTATSGSPTGKNSASGTQGEDNSALASFYGQKLNWTACGVAQCADLTVPVDYRNADNSKTVKIAVLKMTATGTKQGSIVVNPGGPGGSGIDYASYADGIVGASVRESFDIVGFDPRGVGKSQPIDCLSDADLDTFLGVDPTPDDTADEVALQNAGRKLGAGCETNSPDLLPFVSTEEVAQDMDILRAAVGDKKLNYMGKSYGTFLGSTYAGLFPQKVGRMVLDGVLPPDITSQEMNLGQAEGFERATRAYMQDCVDNGNCPFGTTLEQGMTNLRSFLEGLDANPLPTGDPKGVKLNSAWGSLGVGYAMYDQSLWPTLTEAVVKAKAGDGGPLMLMADQYASRTPSGGYTGNIMEVIYAVNCLDRPDSPDLSSYVQAAKEAETKAPTWGSFLAWSSTACGVWPVKGTGPGPHTISAAGSGPIVVVGTTRDPATPYEWSVRLRKELSNAVLLTWDGDGHTAYRRSNACIDDAIDGYFVNGTTPQDGLKC